MKEHYLWDKSGEPDEEIQQLESLLSEFRYQPRPLIFPEQQPVNRAFYWAPTRYAAVAAIVVLALGLGLWFGLRQTVEKRELARVEKPASPSPAITPTPENQPSEVADHSEVEKTAPQMIRQISSHPHRIYRAVHKPAHHHNLAEEGEIAKEVGSSRVDLQACKLEYSIVSPK